MDASINTINNTINNSQDNMSVLELNNPTTAGPENSNIAGAQVKDLKTVLMHIRKEINIYI